MRFLGQLIGDNSGNTKVIIHILEVHGILMTSLLSEQAIDKQRMAIVQNLLEIGFESKIQVKYYLLVIML